MFVVDVIPFARSAPSGSLSYRSSKKLALGTLVEVPLRKQRVRGIVVSIAPVVDAKANLKKASFQLRATSVTTLGSLPAALVKAAQQIALEEAASLGSVLASLLGDTLPETLPRLVPGTRFVEHACEAPRKTREKQYAKRIRTVLAQKRTVLFVVPTLSELATWKGLFAEFTPTVLSGSAQIDARTRSIETAVRGAGLILTTPAFAWIPLAHLDTIIIERASAGTYLFPKRPYLDMRRALRALAIARNLTLVYGDYPLPLEYRSQLEAPLHDVAGTVTVLDARTERPEGSWYAVPETLRKELGKVLHANGRALLLAARRGYAPAVVCRDCGNTLRDARGSAYTLTTERGVRVLRTADGSVVRDAKAVCDVCGSWNLMPLGVGVERVEAELKTAFPDAHIVRFDADSLTTTKARKAAREALLPGTFVVGTEFMLPWLGGVFDLSAVVSADSLLAVPFWRARERFVRIGLSLAERAERTFIVTRRPDDAALSALAHPTTTSFFAEETSLRRSVGYPPFGTLIVFQLEGTRARLESLRAAVESALAPHTAHLLPERLVRGNLYRRTLVLQLPEGAWPDEALSERISHLPPSIRTLINAESLW